MPVRVWEGCKSCRRIPQRWRCAKGGGQQRGVPALARPLAKTAAAAVVSSHISRHGRLQLRGTAPASCSITFSSPDDGSGEVAGGSVRGRGWGAVGAGAPSLRTTTTTLLAQVCERPSHTHAHTAHTPCKTRTAGVQLLDNVGAADELAAHKDLGDGGPLRVVLDRVPQPWVVHLIQNVHHLVLCAQLHSGSGGGCVRAWSGGGGGRRRGAWTLRARTLPPHRTHTSALVTSPPAGC